MSRKGHDKVPWLFFLFVKTRLAFFFVSHLASSDSIGKCGPSAPAVFTSTVDTAHLGCTHSILLNSHISWVLQSPVLMGCVQTQYTHGAIKHPVAHTQCPCRRSLLFTCMLHFSFKDFEDSARIALNQAGYSECGSLCWQDGLHIRVSAACASILLISQRPCGPALDSLESVADLLFAGSGKNNCLYWQLLARPVVQECLAPRCWRGCHFFGKPGFWMVSRQSALSTIHQLQVPWASLYQSGPQQSCLCSWLCGLQNVGHDGEHFFGEKAPGSEFVSFKLHCGVSSPHLYYLPPSFLSPWALTACFRNICKPLRKKFRLLCSSGLVIWRGSTNWYLVLDVLSV